MGHPVIAGFTATTSFIIYLAKPTADIVRQNLADRVERRLRLSPEKTEGQRELPPDPAVKELPPSTFY